MGGGVEEHLWTGFEFGALCTPKPLCVGHTTGASKQPYKVGRCLNMCFPDKETKAGTGQSLPNLTVLFSHRASKKPGAPTLNNLH